MRRRLLWCVRASVRGLSYRSGQIYYRLSQIYCKAKVYLVWFFHERQNRLYFRAERGPAAGLAQEGRPLSSGLLTRLKGAYRA